MKKVLIACLAFLMIFLTACGETKEEYMDKCQDPLTYEEYGENPDEYIGTPYRIEGMVMGAEILEKSKDGHDIYAFLLSGSGNSEHRHCTIQYYEDINDEGLQKGDQVIVYGDFAGISENTETAFRILINGKYLEYTSRY